MRKLLTIGVVCLGFLLAGFSSQAENVIQRDPGDAFPWGAEIPFPWEGIQGTWMTQINGQVQYFSFNVIKYTDGANQLQVHQYGPADCYLLAHGKGYEQNRVVRAIMVGDQGTFNLTVHVFRQADIKSSENLGIWGTQSDRTVTVMKISPLTNDSQKGAERMTYQLFKLSNEPCAVCP